MARVECKKCGALATSKCPYCRSVFPDNQHEAVFSHVLKTLDEGDKITIKYHRYKEEGLTTEENVANVLESLYYILQMMAEQRNGMSFDGYACNHQWSFCEGQESDINCGCK